MSGAAFVDLIENLSDASRGIRFMMPPPEVAAEKFRTAGIGADTHVVAYSTGSIMRATRLCV